MKSYRKLLVLAAGLMAALAATGQTATSTADDAAASKAPVGEFQQRNARYTLRGSDTFDVNFEMTPEYNQALVSVQPDGFVTLRGIGEVKVAGQTVPEATQTIAQAYSKILNHPLISITLRDFQKPFFVADGQLGHPGRYELRGDVTLTLKSGEKIEAYIFNRSTGATLADSWVQYFTPKATDKRKVSYADIARLEFTGKDRAAGKHWEDWVKAWNEKKAAGEKNIALHPEALE